MLRGCGVENPLYRSLLKARWLHLRLVLAFVLEKRRLVNPQRKIPYEVERKEEQFEGGYE